MITLPSQFRINEEVLFWTEYNKPKTVKKAKVVAIKFTESKVLYDIAIETSKKEGYYEAIPMCNIDSCFVHPRNKRKALVKD